MRTLDSLRLGQMGRVSKMDGDSSSTQRLMMLGLMPGVDVKVVQFATLRDPIAVKQGQSWTAHVSAHQVQGFYVWQWRGQIAGVAFEGSTFRGEPIDRTDLAQFDASRSAMVNREGAALAFVLGKLDGKTSLESIATEVSERFSDRFLSLADALDFVLESTSQYRLDP